MSMQIDDPEKSDDVGAESSTNSPKSGTRSHESEPSHDRDEGNAEGGSMSARVMPQSEEDDEEDVQTDQRPVERRERRRNFQHARELMTDELRLRATESSDRLRACLTGSIVVKLRDRSEKYLFDWTGTAVRAEATEDSTGDCVITVSENNLLRIASGDLNPQIGMLSEKIAVQGKLSLAVYFFNLIAPYPPQ